MFKLFYKNTHDEDIVNANNNLTEVSIKFLTERAFDRITNFCKNEIKMDIPNVELNIIFMDKEYTQALINERYVGKYKIVGNEIFFDEPKYVIDMYTGNMINYISNKFNKHVNVREIFISMVEFLSSYSIKLISEEQNCRDEMFIRMGNINERRIMRSLSPVSVLFAAKLIAESNLGIERIIKVKIPMYDYMTGMLCNNKRLENKSRRKLNKIYKIEYNEELRSCENNW